MSPVMFRLMIMFSMTFHYRDVRVLGDVLSDNIIFPRRDVSLAIVMFPVMSCLMMSLFQ